jgi:hypothetical protein
VVDAGGSSEPTLETTDDEVSRAADAATSTSDEAGPVDVTSVDSAPDSPVDLPDGEATS